MKIYLDTPDVKKSTGRAEKRSKAKKPARSAGLIKRKKQDVLPATEAAEATIAQQEVPEVEAPVADEHFVPPTPALEEVEASQVATTDEAEYAPPASDTPEEEGRAEQVSPFVVEEETVTSQITPPEEEGVKLPPTESAGAEESEAKEPIEAPETTLAEGLSADDFDEDSGEEDDSPKKVRGRKSKEKKSKKEKKPKKEKAPKASKKKKKEPDPEESEEFEGTLSEGNVEEEPVTRSKPSMGKQLVSIGEAVAAGVIFAVAGNQVGTIILSNVVKNVVGG